MPHVLHRATDQLAYAHYIAPIDYSVQNNVESNRVLGIMKYFTYGDLFYVGLQYNSIITGATQRITIPNIIGSAEAWANHKWSRVHTLGGGWVVITEDRMNYNTEQLPDQPTVGAHLTKACLFKLQHNNTIPAGTAIDYATIQPTVIIPSVAGMPLGTPAFWRANSFCTHPKTGWAAAVAYSNNTPASSAYVVFWDAIASRDPTKLLNGITGASYAMSVVTVAQKVHLFPIHDAPMPTFCLVTRTAPTSGQYTITVIELYRNATGIWQHRTTPCGSVTTGQFMDISCGVGHLCSDGTIEIMYTIVGTANNRARYYCNRNSSQVIYAELPITNGINLTANQSFIRPQIPDVCATTTISAQKEIIARHRTSTTDNTGVISIIETGLTIGTGGNAWMVPIKIDGYNGINHIMYVDNPADTRLLVKLYNIGTLPNESYVPVNANLTLAPDYSLQIFDNAVAGNLVNLYMP